MVVELIDENEIRHKKGIYANVKCRLCGSRDTRKTSNGESIWTEDKNSKGDLIGQFLCYKCQYESDKTCYKCGVGQLTKSIHMLRYYNTEGLWTGRHICAGCHYKNSIDYRNKNIVLTIKASQGSTIEIVIATVLEIQTCSIFAGDKKLPFSLIHEYYGIIGVKTSCLKKNKWYFNINDYVSADTYFCVGFDENLKNIEAIYVISNERSGDDSIKTGRLSITKNSKKFERYEIDYDCYNHIYQHLM